MDWMPQAVRDGIIVVLVISGPLVLAAALIGLLIGILQAATQVQEQTIGSAMKIIGVFAIIIAAGFWMYQYLNQYTSKTLSTAFTFVPKQTQKAVPNDAFDDDKFNAAFEGEFNPESEIKVLKPEKLEEQLPESPVPPGVPYLGAPEIPKPKPQITALPQTAPKIIKQPTKPSLPASNLQEQKPLPALPVNPKLPQNLETLPSPKVEPTNQLENIQKNIQNNIPPDTNTTIDENTDKPVNETTGEGKENNNEENPSWLNQ